LRKSGVKILMTLIMQTRTRKPF